MHVLTTVSESDGVEGLDILNIALNEVSSNFKTFTELYNQLLVELQNSRLLPKTFLHKYAGINLDNDDTGSILGIDADGKDALNAEDVIMENNQVVPIYPTSTVTIPGNIFPDETYVMRYVIIDNIYFLFPPPEELTEDEQRTMAYVAYWFLPAALTTIKQAYGFTLSNSGLNKLYMTNGESSYLYPYKMIPVFFNDSPYCPVQIDNDTLALCVTGYDVDTVKGNWASLIINKSYYGNLVENNVNGKSLKTTEYLDRCLAHELVHALTYLSIYLSS